MTLAHRRIIYILFFTIFALVAPITVFYTSGYRYSWQKQKITEVGVLGIKVAPSSARIFINNREYANQSPLYLNDLAPNIYTINAQMDGYHSWQKNLEVKSRENTLAYDVVLFKDASPRLLIGGSINAFAFDHLNGRIAVIENGRTVSLYDAAGKKLATLWSAQDGALAHASIRWSAEDTHLLLETNPDHPLYILLPVAGAFESTPGAPVYLPQGIARVRFDAQNNGTLYGLMNSSLVKFTIDDASPRVIAHNVSTFEVTPLGVLCVQDIGSDTALTRYTGSILLPAIDRLATLPSREYDTIFPTTLKQWVAVRASAKDNILLIDTSQSSPKLIELQGSYGIFGNGAKNALFLYGNADEVSAFDTETQQSALIARYGGTLKELFPLYNIPYFLFHVDNHLEITELDDRGERNVISTAQNPDLRDPFVDALGKNVFFVTKDGLHMQAIQ